MVCLVLPCDCSQSRKLVESSIILLDGRGRASEGEEESAAAAFNPSNNWMEEEEEDERQVFG